MAKSEVRWIVTANFTADGAVAYRRADGSWSRVLTEAQVLQGEADAAPFAAAAAKREQLEVSDPYAIDMAFGPEGISPLTARERIRAQGPTVPIRRADGGRPDAGRLSVEKPSAENSSTEKSAR